MTAAARTLRCPASLQTLGMLSRPHGFLERCRRRYGDVFTVNVAPYGRMVFLADPALIRQVFTGDTRLFHVGGVRGRILSPMLGRHSLLLLDEDEHMRERKLMLPAFHGEALRRYPELIREIAEAEVSRWPVGEPIALRPRMQAITLEVILRLVIGVRDPECARAAARPARRGCSTRARWCSSSSPRSTATSPGSRRGGASWRSGRRPTS